MFQNYDDISARLDAVERNIVAERVRCALVQSQIDQLLSSLRQRKQRLDHKSHVVDNEQLSDQTRHIAQPMDTFQATPPATQTPTCDYQEAKKGTITMMPAKADAAADTTTELTSVVHEAITSSHVVQPVTISTSELTGHASSHVDSSPAKPTGVADKAASRAQGIFTTTLELTLSVNRQQHKLPLNPHEVT